MLDRQDKLWVLCQSSWGCQSSWQRAVSDGGKPSHCLSKPMLRAHAQGRRVCRDIPSLASQARTPLACVPRSQPPPAASSAALGPRASPGSDTECSSRCSAQAGWVFPSQFPAICWAWRSGNTVLDPLWCRCPDCASYLCHRQVLAFTPALRLHGGLLPGGGTEVRERGGRDGDGHGISVSRREASWEAVSCFPSLLSPQLRGSHGGQPSGLILLTTACAFHPSSALQGLSKDLDCKRTALTCTLCGTLVRCTQCLTSLLQSERNVVLDKQRK